MCVTKRMIEGEEDEEALMRPLQRSNSLLRDSVLESIEVCVEARKLSYHVNVGGQRKDILRNVSVSYFPGDLSAIMGPSGAGKSSLIANLLGNESGVKEGSVFVNEVEGPPEHFKSVAKLIPQEDVLLHSFSVREVLHFQAELILPESFSKDSKRKRIMEVVESLGLTDCLDTNIGTVENRGISGGQRKRVSIAMDLIGNPAVLFVDEPTSGLDSTTARQVVKILSSLAKGSVGHRRTIICTIHQPSFKIFSHFDKLTLLTKGRVAFHGTLEEVEAFFAGLNFPTPPKENPADHFMECLQDEELCEIIPLEFARHRNETPHELDEDTPIREIGKRRWLLDLLGACFSTQRQGIDELNVARYPTSFSKQLFTLFRRSTYDSLKDRNKFVRTLVMKLSVGSLVGLVWWQVGHHPKLNNIFPLEGAILVTVLNSVVDTLASTLILFPLARSLLIREFRNGSYRLSASYIAMMLSMTLLAIVYVFVMSLPLYFMVGLRKEPDRIGWFLLTLIILTMIGQSVGIIIGAISKDLVEAQNMLMPVLAPMVLFSGYVIPYSQLNNPIWRFFYRISFFQMGLSALQLNELKDLDIEVFHYEDYDFEINGNMILKDFLSLDPSKIFVWHYMLQLLAYFFFITFIGFFVVARALKQRTG